MIGLSVTASVPFSSQQLLMVSSVDLKQNYMKQGSQHYNRHEMIRRDTLDKVVEEYSEELEMV